MMRAEDRAMSKPVEALVRVFSFMRLGNWWFSKIPPLLAVAYLEILRTASDPDHSSLLIGCFIFSVSCVAIFGHVINDAFDTDTDRRAGKYNAIAHLGWCRRTALMVIFLFAGFLPALIVEYPIPALLLLALNYLWPAVYSLPFLRFKERGLLGVICDAMGSHVTPTLFALSLFGTFATNDQIMFPLAITLWSAALGVKGILHHQLMDRDNDRRSGTVTFASKAAPETISRFMTRYSISVELPINTALVIVVYPWCPLGAAALAVYFALEITKYYLRFKFALSADSRMARPNIPFSNEQFYVFWLPLAAAIQMAYSDSTRLWLPMLHATLFYRLALFQLNELTSIVQVASRPFRRRFFGPRR
jgi:hypothetical protein